MERSFSEMLTFLYLGEMGIIENEEKHEYRYWLILVFILVAYYGFLLWFAVAKICCMELKEIEMFRFLYE
jgi:hypothetical protein